MSNIWFSSDMHYGHFNIIRLCNRPFASLEEMHRELISRWNDKVQPLDIVYIIGDFSFMQETQTRKILNSLNGIKHLILGNHDKESKLPKDCFASIQTKLMFSLFQNNDTLLCHYPYKGTPEELQDANDKGYKIKYLERRPEDKGGYLIHGHTHDKGWQVKRKMINVSVEQWNYTPVHIDEIRTLFKPINGKTEDNSSI